MFAKLGGDIDVSRSVAFGLVLLFIALIMFIVYFFMDKKLDAQTGEAEEKDDPFKISDIGRIFQAWALACCPFVCYNTRLFSHSKICANMLQCNLTLTEPAADSFGLEILLLSYSTSLCW